MSVDPKKANRIFFEGNPWPEGHPIKEFSWRAVKSGEDVLFKFELESADYYAEREIEDDDEADYSSDWEAPIVWCNYHSCTLSQGDGREDGIRACTADEYGPAHIDGLELRVDTNLDDLVGEWDDFAMHIYLLGHDAVGDHRISFTRQGKSDAFDIHWTGRVANAYVGDWDFKHRFEAAIQGVPMPALEE